MVNITEVAEVTAGVWLVNEVYSSIIMLITYFGIVEPVSPRNRNFKSLVKSLAEHFDWVVEAEAF